jgi:hypothetical protein
MRMPVLFLAALSACQFSPAIGGKSLTDCTVDDDCPRGGRCDGGACVPQPLRILSLFVDPDVVEAGEACTFHVEAVHSRKPSELRYSWYQLKGPRQEIVNNRTTVASITTIADYVGSYELEVRVENGVEPAAVGRIQCNAIISTDAAFIVPNQGGDCSKLLPCSSFDDAPTVKRYYLGVVPAGLDATYFEIPYGLDLDGVEIHGGYIFPGWLRDLDRAKTTVIDPTTANGAWGCNDCCLSGMTIIHNLDDFTDSDQVLVTHGTNLTVRDSRLLVTSTGADTRTRDSFTLLRTSAASVNTHLEGLALSVETTAFTGAGIVGVSFAGGGGEISDSSIDLRNAGQLNKTGLLSNGTPTSVIRVDRLRVVTGGATTRATAYKHTCGVAWVANSVFDTRGGDSTTSTAGAFSTEWTGCKPSGHIYSSLFIGGDGAASEALSLDHDIQTMTFTNSIFDGGNGATRNALDLYWDPSFSQPMTAQKFEGCVFILEGGEQALDAWVRLLGGAGERTVQQAETLLACPDCLRTAATAAQVDRANSDFHLTADSACCIDTGAPLDAEAPTVDRDGVPWADPPSTGPYQYVP